MEDDLNYMALQLCAVLTAVYGLQVFTGFDPAFQFGETALHTFFTSFLGHSGPEHLFNNLFFIALFGTVLELEAGSSRFIKVFVGSAVFANLTSVFYYSQPVIGSSGGAMGVLAALAVYRPQKPGLAMGVPLPMWSVLAIYVFIQLAGLTGSSTTAYMAHLFGLVAGAFFGLRIKEEEETESSTRSQEKGEEDSWDQRIKSWEKKYMLD